MSFLRDCLSSRDQQRPAVRVDPVSAYEAVPSVESIADSQARFVLHPSGPRLQMVSTELHGRGRFSIHQNHYMAKTEAGSKLGSLEFAAHDDVTATMEAYVEEPWSSRSKPTGMVFMVTPRDATSARQHGLSITGDGRVAVGADASKLQDGVAMGIYSRGRLVLPNVERSFELLHMPRVEGSVVYVENIKRVAVSQGGEWRLLVTEPLPLSSPSDLKTPR